jgi:uncharacterized protein (DUF362 family)
MRMGMNKYSSAVVRYEKPSDSVRKAVALSRGLDNMPSKAKVFIKPNIVVWHVDVPFPKWGVITTSRVIEDLVVILKEMGIDDITIGEGLVVLAKDKVTPAAAFEGLGYNVLKKRYGIKTINAFERPFEEVDLGEAQTVNMNTDILCSDFVINVPVLKTHAQTCVSLGFKNLKGMLDIESRKKCHGPDPVKNISWFVARLADKLPPMFVLLDGIYTVERGPSYDGKLRRSNLIVASADLLTADMVGAKVLGHEPSDISHLVEAAKNRGRPTDLSDVDIFGEKIEDVASYHEWTFPYNVDETLPLPMEKMGIKGLNYYKYDLTMCTYCTAPNGIILNAIAKAWNGIPFDDIEVLTGKMMKPVPGKKKTILLGKCMYDLHKDNPDIGEMIPIKGCPPTPQNTIKALQKAGIHADPDIFENIEKAPLRFMKRYEGKEEFDESFYSIN